MRSKSLFEKWAKKASVGSAPKLTKSPENNNLPCEKVKVSRTSKELIHIAPIENKKTNSVTEDENRHTGHYHN